MTFVLDVPVVDLKMGSNLNPNEIKEGDDVYFECTVKANPKTHRLVWFHDVSVFRTLLMFKYSYEKSDRFNDNAQLVHH